MRPRPGIGGLIRQGGAELKALAGFPGGILQLNRSALDEGAASLLAHETLTAEELPKVVVERQREAAE